MSIMPWGLLWYDDTVSTLEVKVQKAANRYNEKHGRMPNTCFVHPEDLGDRVVKVKDCKVIASPTVLRHHFWIGEAV